MKAKDSSGFAIKRVTLTEKGFNYDTFRLTGRLNGERIRKQFKSREEALGEANRLGVQAANTDGAIRSVLTRLTGEQVIEAESAFARLTGRSLSAAVDWYLTTYRAPVTSKSLAEAVAEFLTDRKPHVRDRQLRDYRDTLRLLGGTVPDRTVDSITTPDVLAFMQGRGVGKKRFNNLRGDLFTFFAYCKATPREWC